MICEHYKQYLGRLGTKEYFKCINCGQVIEYNLNTFEIDNISEDIYNQ